MSCDCHMFHYSVCYNENLEVGSNIRTIKSNWRVNLAFRKFGGDIEKMVIIQDDKV